MIWVKISTFLTPDYLCCQGYKDEWSDSNMETWRTALLCNITVFSPPIRHVSCLFRHFLLYFDSTNAPLVLVQVHLETFSSGM